MAGLPGAGVRRWPWMLALAGLLLAFTVSTLPGARPVDGFHFAWDGLLNNVLYAAAPLLCWARARRLDSGRRPWLVLAAGLAVYAAGNIYWTIFVRPLDPPPFPSPADALYLSFYPLAFVTLLLVIREGRRNVPSSLWLDGIVGGLATAAGAAAALGPLLEVTGGSPSVVATTLAYPLLDLLVLFFVVVALVVFEGRPPRSLWVLAAGLVVFLAADIAYLFQSADHSYAPGTVLDAVWVSGALLMALAPGRVTTSGPETRGLARLPVLVVPVLASTGSVVLLVWSHWSASMPAVAVLLGAGSVMAAVVRLVLTFSEAQSLAGSREQARTDELTGLANRRGLYEQARQVFSAQQSRRVALLVLDLDSFKEVNDSLGHLTGDQLLTRVASRLREGLRDDVVLARLGGDEFAVLMPGVCVDEAVVVGRRLLERLATPIALRDVTLHVEASIGVAMYPAHGSGLEDLLRHADRAMYVAKQEQCGVKVHEGAGDDVGRSRLHLVAELHTALENDQFTLHYQPQLELRTGAVNAVEALVRWQHPVRGLLYPGDFLPLAASVGLMRPLTALVMRKAVAQAAQWARDGMPLTVAVNLPSALVVDADLPTRVAALLAEARLPASALQIEITEDTLMADRQRGRDVLHELRQLGVHVSIDDYGTGYSSLAYLRELPVDELKLDRSFIFSMADDARAAAIVASTVALARSLGLRIVAEGVESAAALAELTRYGCDAAQGYHIGRPVPAVELAWRLTTAPTPQPVRSSISSA
jgi:diguanylate cyclase